MGDTDLDNWSNFTGGDFLKADDVKDEQHAFVVDNIGTIKREKGDNVKLELSDGNKEYNFEMNRTNAARAKELGIKAPKDLLGKKIYFRKVVVVNPKTKGEVTSLRIIKIE
jgi:hypothetical protein